MRVFIYIMCSALVVAVAYWAYTENYTTQASSKRVEELQLQIAKEKEAISVLKAEWAYLNRPERLRELADMNFADLKLVPLAAQHFSEMNKIPLPPVLDVIPNSPISVESNGGKQYP